VRTVADWVLTQAGVARLEAFIEPWNTGSIRVAEMAGFQREGLMRSFAPLGGIRKDALLYAKVTDDVSGSQPPGSGPGK
jgi:RimJ/RimL family protein N-acetyltransferase